MRYTDQTECTIIHRCGRCGKKTPFVSTRRFRVNANKNKLDIWLIYQCRKCGHTLNIPIYERIAPRKIPGELYEKFLANDEALAVQYGCNAGWLKGMHLAVEQKTHGIRRK